MNTLKLEKDDIPYILRNRNRLLAGIHKKMRIISRDMEKTDELYQIAQYSSPVIREGSRSGGWHKDLGDAVEKYEKLRRQQIREYNTLFFHLSLQEEQIERVWICFLLLPEPEYSIIEDMYVKGEKYESAERRSGYSRQVFEKYRKRGIEDILYLYGSEKLIGELRRMIHIQEDDGQREMRKKKKATGKVNDYQITLEDLIGKKGKGGIS